MAPSSASILREGFYRVLPLSAPLCWSVDLIHMWPHFSDCSFYVGCWSAGVCSWGSKSWVSVSQSPPALLELKLWIFKACYRSSSSQCQNSRVGGFRCRAWTPCFSGRTSIPVMPLPLVGGSLGMCWSWSDRISIPPVLVHVAFSLYV